MTEEKYEEMKVILINNLKELKPFLEKEDNPRERLVDFILSHFIQFAQKEIK